ncbi:MAG: PilZ domain-containing protein [Hyphomicrobium sp.]
MLEPRSAPRRRQLKSAVIAFANRHATLPCSVREISDTGARLEAIAAQVPDTFELIVELDGLEAECEVVWRKVNLVGVRFLAPPRRCEPRRTQVLAPTGPSAHPTLRRKPR